MISKIYFCEEYFYLKEINDFYKSYNHLLNEIKFDKLTNKFESTLNREINKALIRSIVRYDTNFNINFINKVKEKMISILGEDSKRYYITKYPYLLIHLPNDTYEEGKYHTDIAFNTGSSITCWIPINNYTINYNPVTVFLNSQNKFNLYALKFLGKISQKLFGFYASLFLKQKLIEAKPNKIFLWKDSTIHKGNLNNKDLIHSAVTFKITEKKNPIESSEIINKKNIEKFHEVFDKSEILDNLNKIKDFVFDNLEKNINQKAFVMNLLSSLHIIDNNQYLNKVLGFATGIIGQRLSLSNFKKEAILFCLISLNYAKNSNDNIYFKNSFSFIFLKKNLNNLEKLI